MRCPKCMGKIKRKSSKMRGGITQYVCRGCHRKYIIDQIKGGLKAV